MNNRKNYIIGLRKFFEDETRILLVTGTHQYMKHKIAMKIIDDHYEGKRIHFRTYALQNLPNEDFLGFTGLKVTPKAGEKIQIGRNSYYMDSFQSNTWPKTYGDNQISIIYPCERLFEDNKQEILKEVIERKNTAKIILISWTDKTYYNYDALGDIFDMRLVYDAKEEKPEYHERMLEIQQS